METQFILIRHGETDWNRQLKYQGQQDISLNEKGFSQADNLKKYLVDKDIDCIYSSDLKRAINTAELIAGPHNLDINTLKGLREMSFGSWEGLTYKEIEDKYSQLLERWLEDPVVVSPPGGETLKEFQKRVVNTFEEILREKAGKKILIVSHGGTIRVWLSSILAIPLHKNWRLQINNTGMSIVSFYDQDPVLQLLNFTEHLE